MKLLLDEQLSPTTAAALNVMVQPTSHEVAHIYDFGGAGMDDADIPQLCWVNGIGGLITVNVKDFGARLHYFAALLEAGIHVAVVRPGQTKMDVGGQVGILAPRIGQLVSKWSAAEGLSLIVVSPGGIRERSLEELVAEIEHRRGS